MYPLLLAILMTLFSAMPDAGAQGFSPCAVLPADSEITAMALGRRGELLVATRDGDIRQIRENGECILLVRGMKGIRSLTVSPRGDIFACSAADGRIFRLDRQGNAEVVADGLGEIHGLAVDRDGGLFVSHGPRGMISRLRDASVHDRK